MSRTDAAERITIRPAIVAGVDWVRCGYDSKLGKIESDWKADGATITIEVTVPAGAEAVVVVPNREGPDRAASRVMEGDVPAEKAAGVTFLRQETGATVYRVGSGVYRFKVMSTLDRAP